jgi:Phage Tail Collar Domain
MSYIINFTDLSKAARNFYITVEDNTINTFDTPLTLVGRNYPGYGQAIGADLVHLLENFANSSRPSKNIEGQLWFDTSDPNSKKLKVFDGTDYAPVAGVHRTPTNPLGGTPVYAGDIWVDTSNNQLSIFNGSSFTLVGPNYSSALRTGSYATTSTAIDGSIHNIVINYVNDNAIEIIAQENFTPVQVIDGFGSLQAGVNLTGKNLGTPTSPAYAKFNGVAFQASNLQQTVPALQTVSANNFVRNDINQKLAGQLTIGTDLGIKIGQDPTFVLQRQGGTGYNATFLNTLNGGSFSFQIAYNNINNTIMVIKGDSQRVGINTVAPQATLDVGGNLNVSSTSTLNTLIVSSTLSNYELTDQNALYVLGGAGVNGSLVVTKEHILVGPLSVGRPTGPDNTLNESTAAIVPRKDQAYDIGSNTQTWLNVWGQTIHGFLAGNAQTASKLVGTSTFTISGDMGSSPSLSRNRFDGTPQTYEIVTTLTAQAIYGKTYVPTINNGVATNGNPTFANDDFIMIYRPSAQPDILGNGTLYKESRYDFLSDLYEFKLSTGAIVPFGQDTAPSGWLLCDGTIYDGSVGTPYNKLFTVIHQKYGGTGSQFAVPDLRAHLGSGSSYINYYIKT